MAFAIEIADGSRMNAAAPCFVQILVGWTLKILVRFTLQLWPAAVAIDLFVAA